MAAPVAGGAPVAGAALGGALAPGDTPGPVDGLAGEGVGPSGDSPVGAGVP
jgi:hypothetical protein